MKQEPIAPLEMSECPTMKDVLDWARDSGENRDAIYELLKIPARLGLLNEEIDLIPADLAHFDRIIAPSPYGMVSRAKNLDTARRRATARIRAVLKRFFAAQGTATPSANVRESYTALIEAMKEQEGFQERGAALPTSTHRPFLLLRAQARVPLCRLEQSEIDRLWADATSEGRKILRKVIRRIDDLRCNHDRWPDIATLLPEKPLAIPASPDRPRRILWSSLPEGFREDADAVFRRALRQPEDLTAWAKEQLKAGRAPLEIDEDIACLRGRNGKSPKNTKAALAGYQGAVSWLLREQADAAGRFDHLTTVKALFTPDAIQAACNAHIARAEASATLKNPKKSATLWGRIVNLTTIARYGLQDEGALAALRVMRIVYGDYIHSPAAMTKDVERVIDRLRRVPHIAASFVNAPTQLHRLASKACTEEGRIREERALRLFAIAAAFAIQVSRPLRPGNLFMTRIRATAEAPRNLTWIEDGRHAEIRFAGAEVKNSQSLTVSVVGSDARILWDWQHVHRPRFLDLRRLEDSPYLFPGSATPRLRKDVLPLPPGAMSPSALAELWDLGDRHLGLGLTPHQCRHAVATLMLAVHPGDFARVASVLGNTEEVARRHYGRDSGERAAAEVRGALLAQHPDIFKRMKGRQP